MKTKIVLPFLFALLLFACQGDGRLFHATIRPYSHPQKIFLDDEYGYACWSDNDPVYLNGEYCHLTLSRSGGVWEAYIDYEGDLTGDVYALYCGSNTATYVGGTYTVNIPQEEQYSATDSYQNLHSPMWAHASQDDELEFTSLFSLLEFRLDDASLAGKYIAYIEFESASTPLSGTYAIGANGNLALQGTGSMVRRLQVNQTYQTAKSYFLTVPPVATAQQFTIRVGVRDNSTTLNTTRYTYKTTTNKTIPGQAWILVFTGQVTNVADDANSWTTKPGEAEDNPIYFTQTSELQSYFASHGSLPLTTLWLSGNQHYYVDNAYDSCRSAKPVYITVTDDLDLTGLSTLDIYQGGHWVGWFYVRINAKCVIPFLPHGSVIDFQGHTVTLKAPLFGYLGEGVTIKNVKIKTKSSSVTLGNDEEAYTAGAMACVAWGSVTLQNVQAETVNVAAAQYAGGMIGARASSVTSSLGVLSVNYSNSTSGIVFNNCSFSGSVKVGSTNKTSTQKGMGYPVMNL